MSIPLELASDAHESPRLLRRFFSFGWAPIVIGAIAMTATYPGRTHGLGTITEPLLRDLGLAGDDGRVLYASLNFWGTMLGALFCLPVGRLLDRFDRRAILAGNLILFGVSVCWMSTVADWQSLFVGLILTRGLGQSALSVVSLTIVAKSFDSRRLGMATAFYAILAVPMQLAMIQGIGWAVTDAAWSWRAIWNAVGLILIALSATAFALGPNPATSVATLDPKSKDDDGATLRQALATPAFWVFAGTISLWGMIYAGVALFNVDIFQERGFDQRLYFNVLTVTTIVALASKMFFGRLVNYVRLNRLLAVCLLTTAASLCGLPHATQPWHAYAYGVGGGIASGAAALLFFAVWGKLYGPRELGRIQGVAQMLTVFASAAGPFVFSFAKRELHGYGEIFTAFAGVMLLTAVAAWFTPLPSRHATR